MSGRHAAGRRRGTRSASIRTVQRNQRHTPTPPTMRTISLRSVAAHKIRLLLTVLAVVLGTAFVAGSSMFTATLSHSMTSVLTTAFDDIDVIVTGTEATPRGLDMNTVEQLRERDDVRAVSIQGRDSTVILTDPHGARINTGAVPTQAIALVPPETTGETIVPSQGSISDGRMPAGPKEIAINTNAARTGGISIGDTITVVVPATRIQARVTGIFSAPSDAAGWLSIALREQDYRDYFTDGEHVQLAALTLEDPSRADAVRDELAASLHGFMVNTGEHMVEKTNERIEKGLSFVTYFLWAFAGIALLVGTFIISNTFSMLVAQRNREYALLRALGASAGQIQRSVVLEAALVGIVGSLGGVAAGIGLVRLITWVMARVGAGLPESGVQLTPAAIIAPCVIGCVVTVLSAWAPARRAGAIHPVQAMRPTAFTLSALRVRTVIGGFALLAGTVLCALSVRIELNSMPATMGIVGAGTVVLILGLWLAGPALSIPATALLGRVLGAPWKTVGHLAATNSRRNPQRTSATAFALTLGLIMVCSIGMLGASMQKSVDDIVDNSVRANFVLSGPQTGAIDMPRDTADRVAALPEVASVSTQWDGPFVVNDTPMSTNFGPPTTPVGDNGLLDSIDTNVLRGTANLDEPGIALAESTATMFHVDVGDSVVVRIRGQQTEFPVQVTAIYDSSSLYAAILSRVSAEQMVDPGALVPKHIFVHDANGVSANKAFDALTAATEEDLVTSVNTPEEFKGQTATVVNSMLTILYSLLALAVVVAILGIINTLALSVIERRQEIGMLRAVGMQRRQVRQMMYLESAVIAVYGALVGAVVGIGVGCAFLENMKDQGLSDIVVPWPLVGSILVASAVVGVLAALWPAVAAARTSPLEAITD